MSRRSPLTRLLPVALLALLAMDVFVGSGLAYHGSREEPASGEDSRSSTGVNTPFLPDVGPSTIPTQGQAREELRNQTTTTPTLDQARDDLLARQEAAVDALNQELARRNVTADGLLPAVPAPVLVDGFDNGTRVGGVGDWKVIGGHWRLDDDAGVDGSAGFTVADPGMERFGTMDALLVSPAVDLSAYVLQNGRLVVVGGRTDFSNPPFVKTPPLDVTLPGCQPEAGTLQSIPAGFGVDLSLAGIDLAMGEEVVCPDDAARFVAQDQINLIFRHRLNLLRDRDGAQVILFTREPQDESATGIVLRPIPLYGEYSRNGVGSLGGQQGFTGTADWNVTAFDLTPWAGKTVWIGFRVATGPEADANPGYFSASAFPKPVPPGWHIDGIDIRAPAYGRNLKVYSILGPTFRADPTDPHAQALPGSVVTVGGTILNAAGSRGVAEAKIEVAGLDNGTFVVVMNRTLDPGETWTPTIDVTAPTTENATFTVRVSAYNLGVGRGRLPDPTNADNVNGATFTARTVKRFDLRMAASETMVDFGAPLTARAEVVNVGNVPLLVDVKLTERFEVLNLTAIRGNGSNETNETNATANRTIPRTVNHTSQRASVAPGQTVALEWAATTQDRGEHELVANATAQGAEPRNATTLYYVHASPPPSFAAMVGDDVGNWSRHLAHVPRPPTDDWAWVAPVVNGNDNVVRVLRAGPLPEAVARGDQYEQLRLSFRYMAYKTTVPSYVAISYVSPLPGQDVHGENDDVVRDLASVRVEPTSTSGLPLETSLSWRTVEAQLFPTEADGYVDAWSLNGLEVRVRIATAGTFYLDDLRLTGIPVGGTEAQRVEIVRVTGNDSAATVLPMVGPAATEALGGNAPSTVGASTVQPVCDNPLGMQVNCWEKRRISDVAAQAGASRWAPGPAASATSGHLWQYGHGPGSAAPDRLVTPPILLKGAVDSLLYVDHEYMFQSLPVDNPDRLEYDIKQMGFVELQYRRDDGQWSEFIRLVPTDGYDTTLSVAPNGVDRIPRNGSLYLSGTGFYHPTPCRFSVIVDGSCHLGGYISVLGSSGSKEWTQYLPTPRSRVSVFELQQPATEHVNLSGREVRIAFHAATGANLMNSIEWGMWGIREVRVTPVSRFAIDGAVVGLDLDTAYDWRALGVGPKTQLPVKVTVENVGLYDETYKVHLTLENLNGTLVAERNESLGRVAAGERRSAIIEWPLPDGAEGRSFVIGASILPEEDDIVQDENPYNDAMRIGQDASLVARKRVHVALSAAGFPETADAGSIRYLPTTVTNLGNVPVDGLVVERRIERMTTNGPQLMEEKAWPLDQPLAADPRGASLLRVAESVKESDLSFIPPVQGTYVVTLTLRREDGTPLDDTPEDDTARVLLRAVQPLAPTQTFERRSDWVPSHPDVWSQGAGFRSATSLRAANATTGQLPLDADAWITTPPLPLSAAQTALLTFVTRYDLEEAYDGAVVEVSNDNRTWHRVLPIDPITGKTGYPAEVSRASPLYATQPGGDRAFTGDSADAEVQLDGWVPVSMNLASVPALSETIVFRKMTAPLPDEAPLAPVDRQVPRVHVAPWMIEDAADPAGRWEIRNETVEPELERWWSGFGSSAALITTSLERKPVSVAEMPREDLLVLSWLDRRPGTLRSDWRGVGGEYGVFVGNTSNLYREENLRVERLGDGWNRMTLVIPRTFDVNAWITIRFEFFSADESASATGWEVRDVSLTSRPAINGVLVPNREPTLSFLGPQSDSAEREEWTTNGWRFVKSIEPRQAPWSVAVRNGADGRPARVWELGLTPSTRANVDTRLVSPAVDLSQSGGNDLKLRIAHEYDLAWREEAAPAGVSLDQRKWYQAGIVEIEVFNRTTNAWDPPRQLFADPAGPSPLPHMRASDGRADAAGAPYPVTLADTGDTFPRFPRDVWQRVQYANGATDYYLREYRRNISYAFSGASGGMVVDEFDLGPYLGEKVRFSFHAWTGATEPANAQRHWRIHAAEVVGAVLSTRDVQVRFRVATDESIRDGSWSIDQVQVTGLRYERSVGIHLDGIPPRVGPGEVVKLTGVIRNYGPGVRENVALGFASSPERAGLEPPKVVVVETPRADTPPGASYAAVAGPFRLAPAGKPGSEQRFEIHVYGPPEEGVHQVRLDVLEGVAAGSALAWRPAVDDVPGRASRQWRLAVVDERLAAIQGLEVDPPALALPGMAAGAVVARNVGTKPLDLSVRATWTAVADSTIVASEVTDAQLVPPGTSHRFGLPEVHLPSVGNYTLKVDLLDGGQRLDVQQTRHFRVGTNDVAFATSFEDAADGWTTAGGMYWQVAEDEGRFGNRSLLFGYSNEQYQGGWRLPPTGVDGAAMSPPIDLRAAGDDAHLAFWHKSRLSDYSRVVVSAQRLDSLGQPDRLCDAWVDVPVPPDRPLGGFKSEWSLASLPLAGLEPCAGSPLLGSFVRVRFSLIGATEQGWRVDGLTVASGTVSLDPEGHALEIGDGGRKRYPITLENHGLAPKRVRLALDDASRLSPAQREWFSVPEGEITLQPGEKATVSAFAEIPSARGAFPQSLRADVRVQDLDLPYLWDLLPLALDFRPEPRPDLAVSVAVDGKPLGAGAGIEEATPHEVTAIVSNLGSAPAGATEVRLFAVNEKGEVVWEHRQGIDALQPVGAGGEGAVVVASWKPVFGARGPHELRALVDPDRLQVDYDRANNVLERTVHVTPLMRPDLVVDARNVTLTTPDGKRLYEATPGQLVRIVAQVRNDGLSDAREVTVRLVAGSSVLKEELVPLLRPGQVHVISTNQIAPEQSTTYQVVAFTPGLELRSENNQHTLELPIFPPELALALPGGAPEVRPREELTLTARLENTAPYPQLVELSLEGAGALVRLPQTRLALGPDEARDVTLEVSASATARAGEHLVLLHAVSAEGFRTRLTVPVQVAEERAADLLVYQARGPPDALEIQMDAVNQGNLELAPTLVVRDAQGREVAREPLSALPVGRASFATVRAALPPATPPGTMPATVELVQDGRTLARSDVALEVAPWGRVDARVTGTQDAAHGRTYNLSLAYEGNVPSTRRPVVLGAPVGTRVVLGDPQLDLSPGDRRDLSVRLEPPAGAAPGLYLAQLAFVEDGRDLQLANLTPLPLDLRRADLELAGAQRKDATVRAGQDVVYVALVRNAGDRAATDVPVELYVDNVLRDRQVVARLDPGDSVPVRLAFEAGGSAASVVVAVDPHGPHAGDATAFAERLVVEPGVLDAVPGASRVPFPPVGGVLAAVLVALAGRRWVRRAP